MEKKDEVIALRVKDAAMLLSISRTMMYELIRRGEIQYAKIGSDIRISRKVLEEYVMTQQGGVR